MTPETTATTFDIVSPEGHYAGGLILPGMEISLKALCKRAAKLPEVSIAGHQNLIARDTASSMQAGSYWGAVESYSGIIRRLREEIGYRDAPIVATGGLVSLLAKDLPEITHHEPHLTLTGLHLLAERHFSATSQ